MAVEFPRFDDIKNIEKIRRLNDILKSQVVSFDIDGVEANSARESITQVNRRFGTRFTISDIKSYYGLADLLKEVPNISDPLKTSIEIWNSPEVFEATLPVSGARILSDFLRKEGVDAYRISSRPGSTRQITISWYQRWMPWVSPKRIYLQRTGEEINTDFKVKTISDLGVRFHFEDSYEEAEQIVKNTDAIVVLVPQPWNFTYQSTDKRIIIPRENTQISGIFRAYFALADVVAQS
ncbi:MAG: hypothetical protein AAB685_03435 [Patescibacteria group bacterium]